MDENGIKAESSDKEEGRLLAVLALLKGEPAAQVSQQYNICHSDLYKYRRRALAAMHSAMKDQRRGPKRPTDKNHQLISRRLNIIEAQTKHKHSINSYPNFVRRRHSENLQNKIWNEQQNQT